MFFSCFFSSWEYPSQPRSHHLSIGSWAGPFPALPLQSFFCGHPSEHWGPEKFSFVMSCKKSCSLLSSFAFVVVERFLCFDMDLLRHRFAVNQVSTAKSLCLCIDENLPWSSHIENLTKRPRVASGIGTLKRICSNSEAYYQCLRACDLTTWLLQCFVGKLQHDAFK